MSSDASYSRHYGSQRAHDAGESGVHAPGKQTLTSRLVQRKSEDRAEPAAAVDAPAPPPRSYGDPFGLHLLTSVQLRGGDTDADPGSVHAAAARGLAGPATALPFAAQVQASFGGAADVSQIEAHVGGAASAACSDMNAAAYATGSHVAFAGAPDLHIAAHEAAHVVQQARGVNLYGGVGAAGDAYEAHADAVADRVVAGQSAEDLLSSGPAAARADAHDDDDDLDDASDAPVQHKAASKDALGKKQQLLLTWKQEMVEVAKELSSRFTPLGLEFRPQILLATALQEAAAKDPLNAVSFDKGLGLMQITPYKGKLDPEVAQAIGWDNAKSVNANIASSKWRSAKANLLAGGYTMLGKATAIKRGAATIWAKMDEAQRWRAVLFAYNAGQTAAIAALKRGGPDARMISTYTNPKGKRVSHDYTAEIQDKIDYVEGHDPFDGGDAQKDASKDTQKDGDQGAEQDTQKESDTDKDDDGDTESEPVRVDNASLRELMDKPRLSTDELRRARTLIAAEPKATRASLYRALQSKVGFANQRDNRSTENGKNIGDVMCNLTALAMCLQYLGVANPHPDMQYEDALEKVRRDKRLPRRTYAAGWGGVAKAMGVRVENLAGPGTHKRAWWTSVVLPALTSGKAVMCSITGHIVRLQDIQDAGIVADDPFGKSKLLAGTKRQWLAKNDRGQGKQAGEDITWPWDQVEPHSFLWVAAFSRGA